MRKSFSLVSSLLFFTACSSTPRNADVNPEFINTDNHYRQEFLKPGDRTPAEAPKLEWKPAQLSVTVTPAGTAQLRNTVQVNQVLTWKENEPYNDFEDVPQDVLIDTTCEDLVCGNGSGKSQLWDKFFSAPKNEKAKALDQAVTGIGPVSAEALVNNRYFSSKPRSWAEFSAEINKAAEKGIIRKSVATNVIYNNRAENAEKLGYGAQDCQIQRNACTIWISKLVKKPVVKYREVEKSKIQQTRVFNVSVDVSEAKLLPFEKETLVLNVSEEGRIALADENGPLNSYKLSYNTNGSDISANVVAQHRNQIDLPSRVVQQDFMGIAGYGSVNFAVDVNSQYIPSAENDPQAQLTLDYTVQVCEYGWTGTCGFDPWRNYKSGSVLINQARTMLTFKVPGDLPRKNKVRISYTVTRNNSIYFNNKPSGRHDSDSVKTPK